VVVPQDSLSAQLSASGSDNAGAAISGDQGLVKYLTIAKKMNASYLLNTAFMQDKGKKAVKLSLELIAVENQTTDTFAVNTPMENPVDNIEAVLDSCVNRMLLGGSISLLPREKKLLGINIVGSGKNARTIGAVLAGIKTLKGKEHENSAQDLKKIVNQDSKAYLAYYVSALEFAKAQRYEDAALMLRDLILKIGQNYPALYPLAARYFRLSEKNEDALQIVNMAQGMKLTTDALLLEKALVFEALEEVDKAESAYHEVLVCDSTNYDALLFMIKKFNKENRSYEALPMAKRITSTYPEKGIGYLELGKCLIGLKQTREAKQALEKATELMPDDGVSRLLLGDLCAADHDYKCALEHFKKAMTLNAQNVDLFVKTAQASVALGDASGALDMLKKVEKQFYDNPPFLKEIGIVEFQLGDTAKAQHDLNRFSENGGRDAEVFSILGTINENKNDLVKARGFYEKAQLMEPDNADVREKLAALIVKTNLAEKGPGQESGKLYGNEARSSPGKGHGRIVFQISTGVLCLGSVAAGIFMDKQVSTNYSKYQTTHSVSETQSLHTKIDQDALYRNILYSAGGVMGIGCCVTFFIPSKN
jgi:tetratricopeptide (TPR) repeat protein